MFLLDAAAILLVTAAVSPTVGRLIRRVVVLGDS